MNWISLIPQKRLSGPRRGPVHDEAYKAFIREWPCAICSLTSQMIDIRVSGRIQGVVIECAHVGNRGLWQKCSDHETIPLCRWHHTLGPESHHVLGRRFWEYHGVERDKLIQFYQNAYGLPSSRALLEHGRGGEAEHGSEIRS